MKRSSGILMHISSLWGEYGCGSFGKPAYEFIDFLHDSGFTYWQVLPFCITNEYNSPYMSHSSFGGNPNFIDLEELAKKGLITADELDSARQHTPYSCEFDRLTTERFALLKKAASRVTDRTKIDEFLAENKPVAKCCVFLATKEANNGKPWTEWEINQPDEEALFTWQFIQYEFHRQWSMVHSYAKVWGIKIIGDLPFYVAHDSCDVWSDKKQFLLDDENMPTAVAGVPPDFFAQDGQLWGNPLYDWDVMRDDGFSWWKERMSYMLTLFDGVRIDHFRALSDFWSVPADSTTAKDGHWVEGPRTAFTQAMAPLAQDRLIIAEDLSVSDDNLTSLLKESGYPGMAVFQFGFDGNWNNTHLPHNYHNNLVAYTGTHDNNTLLGFMWEIGDNTRQDVLNYIGYGGADWDRCYETIIRNMLASSAGIVIFPIQDILGYGSDTRLNTPGRADGNWQYRVTRDQLFSIDRNRLQRMNTMYSR